MGSDFDIGYTALVCPDDPTSSSLGAERRFLCTGASGTDILGVAGPRNRDSIFGCRSSPRTDNAIFAISVD
jgi:hypothetical protein